MEVWEPAVGIEIRRRTHWISHDVLELRRQHFVACLKMLDRGISWRRIVANNLDDPRITEEERKELCQNNRKG